MDEYIDMISKCIMDNYRPFQSVWIRIPEELVKEDQDAINQAIDYFGCHGWVIAGSYNRFGDMTLTFSLMSELG